MLHGMEAWWLHSAFQRKHRRDNDCWIASYPCSGAKWLRWLLHDVIFKPTDDARLMRARMPNLHDGLDEMSDERERFISTHYPHRDVYKKVLYLVRDPADCMVKYYRRCKRDGTTDLSFVDWVDRENLGKGAFGAWDDHIKGYKTNVIRANLRILRYEDLVADPANAVAEALSFAGLVSSVNRAGIIATKQLDDYLQIKGIQPAPGYRAKCRQLAKLEIGVGEREMGDTITEITESHLRQTEIQHDY